MIYLIVFVVGVSIGGLAVWLLMMSAFEQTRRKQSELRSLTEKSRVEMNANREKVKEALEANRVKAKELALRAEQLEQVRSTRLKELALKTEQLEQARSKFSSQVITFEELKSENAILKADLKNFDVSINKSRLDQQIQDEQTKTVLERSQNLAVRYLSDSVKSIIGSLGSNNFAACKQRLIDVIVRCRAIGFSVSASEEAKLLGDLKIEFEKAVRAAFEREEQSRIKSQIREEEKLKREIERELKQLERERLAIQAALDQALAAAKGEHSAEVERLQARLTEAELKAQRTMSMAQQTKSGHIYVISNIGSMGQGIFKVGMTRRLEPQERVYELGSASVPFPFDIHMMIKTDNAPALENALHRALHKRRVNRANPRKEFFRSSIEEIREIVKQHHGEVTYVVDPEALEYRQTLTMSEEDAALIEAVYDAAEAEVDGEIEE